MFLSGKQQAAVSLEGEKLKLTVEFITQKTRVKETLCQFFESIFMMESFEFKAIGSLERKLEPHASATGSNLIEGSKNKRLKFE